MKTLISFVKKEAVLCIAAVFALFSMLFVAPDSKYIEYIDFKVLTLLFCLMIVVAGFKECGLFELFAERLLAKQKNVRSLILVLVMLPFVVSMFVTNDVALIAFVPFVFPVLKSAKASEFTIKVIVFQTLAANLGSMLTPVGNPQNLYLYSYYNFSIREFFSVTFPLTLISMVLLISGTLCIKNKTINVKISQQAKIQRPTALIIYVVLFVLCLLAVFKIVHYGILLAIIMIAFLIISPKLFRDVDYGLLITFVFFFIFSGNLGRIPEISEILNKLTESSTLLSSALASQVISNVPAAVLLSEFTDNRNELLAGVNIGGLGTPIASLASLISLKFYLRSENARPLKYILYFSAANFISLTFLICIYYVIL